VGAIARSPVRVAQKAPEGGSTESAGWVATIAGVDTAEVSMDQLKLPLALPPPMEFASLPEHLAEDVVEFVLICQDELYPEANDVLFGHADKVDAIFSLVVRTRCWTL
jgi:hypothetical protein